jgi:hypothetical protein
MLGKIDGRRKCRGTHPVTGELWAINAPASCTATIAMIPFTTCRDHRMLDEGVVG